MAVGNGNVTHGTTARFSTNFEFSLRIFDWGVLLGAEKIDVHTF